MKSLITTALFILIISKLFVNAQSANTDSVIDEQQTWIKSLLSEQGKSINSHNYIFYCTGHHGIVWSLIASDSSGIYLYNGTTRNHIDYANQSIPDTLSFIRNNIKTITWGIDSLANTAQLITLLKNDVYNPIYSELYIIKDGNIAFCDNGAEVFYNGSDSTKFYYNLNKLNFLMLWLAAPSCRSYLPRPGDTLLYK